MKDNIEISISVLINITVTLKRQVISKFKFGSFMEKYTIKIYFHQEDGKCVVQWSESGHRVIGAFFTAT